MTDRLFPRRRPTTLADAATLPAAEARSRVVAECAERLGVCIDRLARGAGDPTHRRVGADWWRASVTPDGGVLLHLRPVGADVVATAWGPGAEWALEQCPRLLGCDDDPAGFDPGHELLRVLWRRHPWLRVGATDRVCESLLPSVIEQKVTGAEAFRSLGRLTRLKGEPAPGPARLAGHPAHGMRLPLTAEQWAGLASWDYLQAGVEQKRSASLVAAARRGSALERTLRRPREEVGPALCSLSGIGPWTSARTRQQAHGDPDAWSVGDYHVPGFISMALVGEKLDDDAVEELLEPYAGHRHRVEQLVLLAGPRVERHGPRRSLPTHLPG